MKFQGTELERQMALCNLTTSVATLGLEFDKKFFQDAIETIDTFVKEAAKLEKQGNFTITGGKRTHGILKDAYETISFIEKRIKSVAKDEKLVALWNVKGKEYKAWLDKALRLAQTTPVPQ